MASPVFKSLQELLDSKSDLCDFFYNDTRAPHAPAGGGTPVPAEHSSWIEEQHAWRNTAVLFDQSHHMPELFLRGPDAMRLLSELGVNSFANFVPGKAKQYIACNHEGYVIGETLLYCHGEEDFELVSGAMLLNWVEFNVATGKYDVTLVRDNNTAWNPTGTRVKFRFGMDGPAAQSIFAEAVEGVAPHIPFFSTAKVRIAGCDVLALRHGMAGHQGVEISGSYEDGPKVRKALEEIGEKHGLKAGGALAYLSACGESGWMSSPFPAIYTSPSLRAYREWLPASCWEAHAQLGGSFVADSLEAYYVTPWDLGVDKRIKFDHEFVGNEALQKMASAPKRARRTLVWNSDDVSSIYSSLLEPGLAGKLMRFPWASYAFQQYDAVRSSNGDIVGRSAFVGYSANEQKVLSLVMIDLDHAEEGTELVLTWGEPDGGSRKPHVERHRQMEVRVTVARAPYPNIVQKLKHSSL